MLDLNIVLFEPEIPQNTGNIVRTCAAAGAKLHLIKPLGFSMEDRYLKRAGLDYWDMVEIKYYENTSDFFRSYPGGNINLLTKTAFLTYDRIDHKGQVFLVFGKETTGLPENILKKFSQTCYRIPMIEDARSLNLSNTVAIVVYDLFRKTGFSGLKQRGG